eukprot:TRINITY_DN5679_c1_g3_i1.p1 TRINITY_DN5679_c1_g3~~TRINITY_DN5679_c1_g3_i1.p1  ORF type:complete len:234 (+),score=15.43 TRINITY_DN5679_c1_g3_i1:125-826(+)
MIILEMEGEEIPDDGKTEVGSLGFHEGCEVIIRIGGILSVSSLSELKARKEEISDTASIAGDRFTLEIDIHQGDLPGWAIPKTVRAIRLVASGAPLSLGTHFLSEAQSLTSIDTSGLANAIREVGPNFLANCTSLTSINLSPFPLEVIPCGFLLGCTSLTSLDFSPLAGVRAIQSHFMWNCSSLVDLDLRPLGSVVTLSPEPFRFCSSLKRILLPDGDSKIRMLPDYASRLVL